VQFVIDERNELFQGAWFASSPGLEQLGNLLGRKFLHLDLPLLQNNAQARNCLAAL
jgi:hypothetical protein